MLLPPVFSAPGKAGGSTEKMRAAYTDKLPEGVISPNPGAQIFYAVYVFNDRSRSAGLSNQAAVPAAATLPPPGDFHLTLTTEGVVLSWSQLPGGSEAAGLWHQYRVYRREEGSKTDTVVAEVPFDTASPVELVDRSFEWEKTYSYRATVVTMLHPRGQSGSEVEGDDTPVLTVLAHDTFPPAVPSGLQAVFSGLEKEPFVDLVWAPDTDADLAGYNIYRREEGSSASRINSVLLDTAAYRDASVRSGYTYYYSVSAVDVRGNESTHSQEASERVP